MTIRLDTHSLAEWNRAVPGVFGPIAIRAPAAGFRARLQHAHWGSVSLTRLDSVSARVDGAQAQAPPARGHALRDAPLLSALMTQLSVAGGRVAAALGSCEEVQRLVSDLLVLTWPAVGGAVRGVPHGPLAWTPRVLSCFSQRLGEAGLSGARVADELGLSPRYVQQIFARMGTTAGAYILDQRLRRAAVLLRSDAERSIGDIAMALGFCDAAHFSRCFRGRHGCSPSQWRVLQAGTPANP